MKKMLQIGGTLALLLISQVSLGQDANILFRTLPSVQNQTNSQSNVNPQLPFNVGMKKIKESMNYQLNETTKLGMDKKLNLGLHISF